MVPCGTADFKKGISSLLVWPSHRIPLNLDPKVRNREDRGWNLRGFAAWGSLHHWLEDGEGHMARNSGSPWDWKWLPLQAIKGSKDLSPKTTRGWFCNSKNNLEADISLEPPDKYSFWHWFHPWDTWTETQPPVLDSDLPTPRADRWTLF